MSNWNFSFSGDSSRIARLEASPPFAEISAAIADSMRILCTHSDPCDEAKGFTRIVCCVSVDRNLFDLFFNSEKGYRGQYFLSEEAGILANSSLLQLLALPLATFTALTNMTTEQAELSLRKWSAKAWLVEVGKGFCRYCEGEWTPPQYDEPEILNDRWEHGFEANARYGRKAPVFEKLRIMGAFVDSSGREYVTKEKWNRAQQINEFGWS